MKVTGFLPEEGGRLGLAEGRFEYELFEILESDILPGPLEVTFAVEANMNGAILVEDTALPTPNVTPAFCIIGE